AATATTPANPPATISTSPHTSAANQYPTDSASHASANSTPRPIPKVTITGINRQVSTIPRNTLSLNGGSKVRAASEPPAVRRKRTGGLPSHDEPALAFSGAADRTATRP